MSAGVVPIREMRVGDLEPSLTFYFGRPDIKGKIKNEDVSAATGVSVKASFQTTPTVTEWTRACTLIGGNKARMDFQSGDLTAPGILELEVEITWGSARPETLPGFYYIEVLQQKT